MSHRRPYGRGGPVAYPPIHSHPSRTQHLTQQEAQPLVANYVARTQLKPYYHPDSYLEPDGVQYGPRSGRNGGIVIHYLRRVEAGLKGEHLPLESKAELDIRFGEEEIKEYSMQLPGGDEQTSQESPQLPAGDDARLDALIAAKEEGGSKKTRKGILKRKREAEDVAAWAEGASSQASAPLPSSPPAFPSNEMQPLEEYQREQQEWVGEVGERDADPASRQGGTTPFIVKHDRNGTVQVPKEGKVSAAERKAAKKLRNKERVHQKEKEKQG